MLTTVDEYINQFPEDVQLILNNIRQIIHEEAPEATEKISYQMPTFVYHGNLVHFAGYKNHIGFYPTPSGITAFQKEIEEYKNAKGSVQFPHNQPFPISIIKRIIKYRVAELTSKLK